MLGGGYLHSLFEFYNASETMSAIYSPEQSVLQKQAYRIKHLLFWLPHIPSAAQTAIPLQLAMKTIAWP